MLGKIFCAFCGFFYLLCVVKSDYGEEEEKQPTYITARVGHYVLLNCDVDFPQDMVIPYMIKWKKDVSLFLIKEKSIKQTLLLFGIYWLSARCNNPIWFLFLDVIIKQDQLQMSFPAHKE